MDTPLKHWSPTHIVEHCIGPRDRAGASMSSTRKTSQDTLIEQIRIHVRLWESLYDHDAPIPSDAQLKQNDILWHRICGMIDALNLLTTWRTYTITEFRLERI